jgi:hypothetical protein
MEKKIEDMTIVELHKLKIRIENQINIRKELQSRNFAKAVQKINPEIKYFGLNDKKIKI